ncbi:MAG: T9SS C-terminal target domain-containing protein [Bacteroidia bacterium]|nr:MAG: T9SS C-terminal target domain-containing protein [Bacteroidia bacterium]
MLHMLKKLAVYCTLFVIPLFGMADKIHDIRLDRFYGGPFAQTGHDYDIHGEITYLGSGTFSSLYMHHRVNEEEVHTIFFEEIDLNPMIPFYYLSETPWVPAAAGLHELQVWFSGLNGAPVDEGASDTLVVPVDVYDYLPEREITLLESFSSMNCGSCAILNPQLRAMIQNQEDTYAMIFYHPFGYENSPIYHFNPKDNDSRRAFYEVTFSPFAAMGSFYQGSAEWITEERMELKHSRPAAFTIDGTYHIQDGLLFANIETESFANFFSQNLRLMVSLTEDHIEFDSPPGSNGEKDFYHVMRSFIPDANGIFIQEQEVGSTFSVQLPFDVSQGQIDTTQIELLAFIQDMETMNIHQTSRLVYQEPDDDDNGDDDNDDGDDDGDETSVDDPSAETGMYIYPNPGNGLFTIRMLNGSVDGFIRIFDLRGRLVHQIIGYGAETMSDEYQLDLCHLDTGFYILQIESGNKLFNQKISIIP